MLSEAGAVFLSKSSLEHGSIWFWGKKLLTTLESFILLGVDKSQFLASAFTTYDCCVINYLVSKYTRRLLCILRGEKVRYNGIHILCTIVMPSLLITCSLTVAVCGRNNIQCGVCHGFTYWFWHNKLYDFVLNTSLSPIKLLN